MRRPGFLGETHYWFGAVTAPTYPRRKFGSYPRRNFGYLFGDSCWVCEGKRCKNICTKEVQLAKAKARHGKMHAVAAKQPKKIVAPSLDESKFKLIPNEPHNKRLRRLQKMGLYTPGGFMSRDYSNLVNFGTRDAAKIRQIKSVRARETAKANLRRYGTTNIRQIAAIVEAKKKVKDGMWLRVYGTDNADKIFALTDKRRKALCDADAECVRIRKEEKSFR